MKIANNAPILSGKSTQAQTSGTISYNQPAISYNEAGYTYGGIYGFSDVQPLFSRTTILRVLAKAKDTLQNFYDQNISYNQAGISYNEVGYAYGGFYGYKDIQPIYAKVAAPRPTIANYGDIYTPGSTPPPPGNNQSIGPGWFMLITQ